MFARFFAALIRSYYRRQAELQEGMRHLKDLDRRRS